MIHLTTNFNCSTLNIFRFHCKLCEITANVLVSNILGVLKGGQGHPKKYQNEEFSSIYHQIKFKQNLFINIQLHVNFTVFLCRQ